MAAITWTDVMALAPELSSVSTDGRTYILAHVNTALNLAEFDGEDGPKTRLARIYLAAHFGAISLAGATGASGPVTSESAGGLSRSYGTTTSTSSGSGIERTGYGQLYLQLVRTSPARAPLVL